MGIINRVVGGWYLRMSCSASLPQVVAAERAGPAEEEGSKREGEYIFWGRG